MSTKLKSQITYRNLKKVVYHNISCSRFSCSVFKNCCMQTAFHSGHIQIHGKNTTSGQFKANKQITNCSFQVSHTFHTRNILYTPHQIQFMKINHQ